jgi:imidazolonepropionase-like amidohydrolase
MTIIIKNGTVFDALGESSIPDGVVTIDDSQIGFVGTRTDFERLFPARAPDSEVIDAGGGFIMPGLINAHEHLDIHELKGVYQEWAKQPIPWHVTRMFRNALIALGQGVTTVRDTGALQSTSLMVRKAIDEGMIIGPRVIACGQPISMTGGHGYQQCIEADGPDAVRKAARTLLKSGADFIKLMASGGMNHPGPGQDRPWFSQLNEDEMSAAFEEAKKAGKKCTVHCHPPAAIQSAIAAGTDCVEHGGLIDEETAELMADMGVFLVPTLATSHEMARRGREMHRPDWLIEWVRESHEPRMRRFQIPVTAGVRMAVGTDTVPTVAQEMAFMHQGGLTAAQVLLAATRNGAELCGILDQVGTLEPHKRADVIVVDGNPLGDMSVMSQVKLVIKDGEVFFPSSLAHATGIYPL